MSKIFQQIIDFYKQSVLEIKISKHWLIFLFLLFLIICFYPTNSKFYANANQNSSNKFVYLTDNYMRHITEIAAFGVPIIKKDPIGFIQAINVRIGTSISTYAFKRLFNDVHTFNGRRLGERPFSKQSSRNMPSGHSSVVSCGAFFIIFRYGLKNINKKFFALFLLLVCIATMYARVMLNMHTISATMAGFLLGLINAMIFTSPFKNR